MAGTYQLPNPNSPATNDGLSSLAIRQNFQSLRDQINNADGAALQVGTVTETALADAVNPRLFRTQAGTGNFVVSGLNMAVPASSLSVSLPSGTAYVNGYLTTFLGSTITVNASQDTYLDLKSDDTTTQQGVTNGTAAPSLAAGNLRLAKIVSNGTQITAITQKGYDSLSNPIFPKHTLDRSGFPPPISGVFYKTSAAAIPSATWTAVTFDGTHFNNGYIVSGNQIKVLFSGLYRVTVQISYSNTTVNTDTLTGVSFGTGAEGQPTVPWLRQAFNNTSPTVQQSVTASINAGTIIKGWSYMGGNPTVAAGNYGATDGSFIAIDYLGPAS